MKTKYIICLTLIMLACQLKGQEDDAQVTIPEPAQWWPLTKEADDTYLYSPSVAFTGATQSITFAHGQQITSRLGEDDAVNLGDVTSFDIPVSTAPFFGLSEYPTGDVTISCWINVNVDDLNSEAPHTILYGRKIESNNQGLETAPPVMGLVHQGERLGFTRYRSYDDDNSWNYYAFAPAALDAGPGWYHLTVVFNVGYTRLYVGKPADAIYKSFDYGDFGGRYIWNGRNTQDWSDLTHYGFGDPIDATKSIGGIDDVAIWNSALTEKQVLAMYQCMKENEAGSCWGQSVNVIEPEPLSMAEKFSHVFSNEREKFVKVGAHRNVAANGTENSRSALQEAIDLQVDVVELDVWLTSDDQLVVFSDPCLDRLTGQTGLVRSKTLHEINALTLKTVNGKSTNENILTLREALDLAKTKTTLCINIRNTGDDEQTAFEKAARMLIDRSMLEQTIIKGTLEKQDVENSLNTISTSISQKISLNSLKYMPVVNDGWSNTEMARFMAFVNEGTVPFAEVNYKTNYDKLLERNHPTGSSLEYPYNHIDVLEAAGITPGVSSFWPDNSMGVLSMSSTDCTSSYLDYDFKNEATGSTKPTDQKDDGRGSWDWILKYKAKYIATSKPKLLLSYLNAAGLRETTEPLISELKIPKSYLDYREEGNNKAFRMVGRKINDLSKVEFFVPNTKPEPLNWDLANRYVSNTPLQERNLLINPWNSTWLNGLNVETRPTAIGSCKANYQNADNFTVPLDYPIYSLAEWSQKYDGYDIYLNVNRFDTRDPLNPTSAVQKIFYGLPCTSVLGLYAVPDNQNNLKVLNPDHKGADPNSAEDDAFLIMKDNSIRLIKSNTKEVLERRQERLTNPELSEINSRIIDYVNQHKSDIAYGLGGHILVKDGQILGSNMSDGAGRTKFKKRTLVGLRGNAMYIVSVMEEITSQKAAELMYYEFGCPDVFQFDSGGSVSMLTSVGGRPEKRAGLTFGNSVNAATPPSDRPVGVDKGTGTDNAQHYTYRPVPNFLGIKVKK